MKFLKLDGDTFVFQIGKREKKLLLDMLSLYPLIPPSHHRISQEQDSAEPDTNQALLEEALAEHRHENKKQLQAMLADKHRFQENAIGYRLSLNGGQVEWLLQVVNDIRVGSWLLLGSPDEKQGKPIRLNARSARHLWAMELAGHFEAALLSAWEQL